jgi:DNA-binding NarL/FixJ family response regulator
MSIRVVVGEDSAVVREGIQRMLDRRDDIEVVAACADAATLRAAIAEQLVVTKRAVERDLNAIFLKLDLRDAEDVSRRVKAALVYLADQAE